MHKPDDLYYHDHGDGILHCHDTKPSNDIGEHEAHEHPHHNVPHHHHNDKAVLNRLSRDLTDRYGKGFSHSNVVYMCRLYLTYLKSQTLSDFLSWSHYIELLKIDAPLERSFYEKECEEEHWGVRGLEQPMQADQR